MSPFVRALNVYRNIKGRYDLMMFLFKWDPDYRKDLTVTLLAFTILGYSIFTWNSVYDIIAMVIEASIIMVQLGGEMSILPADYRPQHGGVRYSVQNSTHVAYDELSFPMSEVLPAPVEDKLGFFNPFPGNEICKESPLVSDAVDDAYMLRAQLPYVEDKSEINYISSRHQLRYIAIRVANKIEHTTNGVLLSFYDLADGLVGDRPVRVRKAFYYDALLTMEAFRSRIFRGNLQKAQELYTDLTTYFPVKMDQVNGYDRVRFMPDFINRVSNLIGITSLLITENKRVAMLFQGHTKAIGPSLICLGGSGSLSYADLRKSGNPADFRDVVAYGLARETCEETGMGKHLAEVRKNTMVTGFFRWVDRCGLPEFIGITRAGKVPFFSQRAIDGDEVIRFEEVPITINKVEDFSEVMDYIKKNNYKLALSSLMALRRMIVIGSYNNPQATPEQQAVYKKVTDFLNG